MLCLCLVDVEAVERCFFSWNKLEGYIICMCFLRISLEFSGSDKQYMLIMIMKKIRSKLFSSL